MKLIVKVYPDHVLNLPKYLKGVREIGNPLCCFYPLSKRPRMNAAVLDATLI